MRDADNGSLERTRIPDLTFIRLPAAAAAAALAACLATVCATPAFARDASASAADVHIGSDGSDVGGGQSETDDAWTWGD